MASFPDECVLDTVAVEPELVKICNHHTKRDVASFENNWLVAEVGAEWLPSRVDRRDIHKIEDYNELG